VYVVHLPDLYALLEDIRADRDESGFRLQNLDLVPFLGDTDEIEVLEAAKYFLDGVPCPLVDLLQETGTGIKLDGVD